VQFAAASVGQLLALRLVSELPLSEKDRKALGANYWDQFEKGTIHGLYFVKLEPQKTLEKLTSTIFSEISKDRN
jgi:hypothetical protein